MALVVRGQIGTDDAPALTAVRGLVDVLAAIVNAIVIVRRDGQRTGPVPTILHIGRRPAKRGFGPRGDLPRLPRLEIDAREHAIKAAAVGDVIVDRIGNREAALASAAAGPVADSNGAAKTTAATCASSGPRGCYQRRRAWPSPRDGRTCRRSKACATSS